MKSLLKLAFLGGIAAVAWKEWQARRVEPTGVGPEPGHRVRDAGPAEQHIDPRDWDLIDEQMDESFPASDPPGNYRGLH